VAAPWEKYAGAQASDSGAAETKPWESYAAPTETRMETEDEVNARVKAKYSNMSIWDRVAADLGFVGKEVSAIPRGLVKGVSSIPTLAADVGVASRNLATGSNYELPSQMFERDVYDRFLPMNNTPSAKALEFGASLVGGMKMPAPQVNNAAPAGFARPGTDAIRQQTLANSKEAGYVVPPSTTNPSGFNTFLESFGGKIATAQDAALRNQNVTNELAKKSLGLTGEAPLAQETFGAVRREAGKAYEALRQVPSVAIDDATAQSLDTVSAKFTGSKLKEALGGGNDIPKIIQAIKAEPLTGDTAVDAIALLRNKADEAYRAGSKEIGKGYKSIANTIENLMEKNLSGEALTAFRDARQLIAKTHSVEGAFNASTGNVVATKLAAQLAKGKPLSGDLRTAAQFGQAFPKAAREMADSGAVRNADAILGSGAAVFTGHPWYLGWPFLRQGARSFLLSNHGQNLATQRPSGISPEAAMALITASEQSRQSLLK
jgi:hypothetical protein